MYILGISSYYHDSAAALLKDGKIVAAAEEERFTRIKHDNSFPSKAIDFCLKNAGISKIDLEYVAYYEKPLLKFERILETFVATWPFSLKPFIKAIQEWLGEKIKVEQKIRKKLDFKGKIYFVPHHLSHAAAAFYPSPFKKSAILTVDGVGEYQTIGIWKGMGNKIKPIKEINFPHSLGLLYSTFTAFLGFRVNDDEYKVMGMAAYGKPSFKNSIYELIDIKDDGSLQLDLSYFGYRESFQMWNKKFEQLFGEPRNLKAPITQRHKDIAASIQTVTEEIYFKILKNLYLTTKINNLCIGGGVALNALANGKIYKNTPFKKVFILGPSGDSGGAVGSALEVYNRLSKKAKRRFITHLKFGSKYKDNEIEMILKAKKLTYKKCSSKTLIKKTAKLLSEGRIIGWFQDRMEFGPRALGSRSILSAPFPFSMKEEVNVVKRREQFRPFAGSILLEKAVNYFKIPKTQNEFPFMNFCFPVREIKIKDIPAITHEDRTCRIQTVSKNDGAYYSLIREFERLTSIPVILNTSFNLRGEPIVENPEQAINDYTKTKIDSLVIGSFIVYKK